MNRSFMDRSIIVALLMAAGILYMIVHLPAWIHPIQDMKVPENFGKGPPVPFEFYYLP